MEPGVQSDSILLLVCHRLDFDQNVVALEKCESLCWMLEDMSKREMYDQ